MKEASSFKTYTILLIALMIACTVFLTGCFGDSSDSSSASNTPDSAITPIGVPAACLTVHSPSLLKLAGGDYRLVDVIDNCGKKAAGPLKITAQIDAGTTKESTNLFGPTSISASGKAMYGSSEGQKGRTNKEIYFQAPISPSALITILVTINGSMQGEWDGQVTIPGI